MNLLATIRTAIQLYDGMTQPLRSMHQAMTVLIDGFETMQRTSASAINADSIREARIALDRASVTFDELEQNIRNAGSQQERFNQRIRSGTNEAGSLWNRLKQIAITVGSLAAVKKVINLSDTLASTNARLNLLVDDGGSVAELEQQIMASAQRSRSAYFDTASAVAKLGLNAGGAFDHDMNQVIAFMEQVNKQFVIGGATAQEQSNAMIQLTQAMAAGALRGEELNSILEGAPGIARAIEQYMGIAEGSIKKYASQGLVTADIVKNALFSIADETNAKFDSMPKTWAQIWIGMKNKALSIFQPILQRINEIGNSGRFSAVADGLINTLAGVAAVAAQVFDLLIGGAALVIDNWSWLSPIIYGVAGALLVYYGVQAAVNAVTLISKGIHLGMAAAEMARLAITGALTAATAAQTAAQYGLNTALYACPIVWIILLIIALVALFYAAVAAVNKFAGTSVSATGIICGVFMVALAFIGNLFIALWNVVAEVFVLIYNLVAAVANFIGNIFVDPVGAICRLFFDLADTVLGVLEALAGAIDTIFGSNLAGAVSGWRDSLGGWVDDTFGQGETIMEKMSAGDLKMKRFEYGAAYDMGYSFGEGIDQKVSGLFDFEKKDPMGAGNLKDTMDIGNTLDGVYNNTGDTAGNTAAMKDELNIAEEDLAYMRDIAEREAINRYTTAEIKIEQQNTNYISKDTDLDGILNAWANDFAEKMDVSEEGVHP
ncbi:MAG: tape measure protein [Butyricicoccus pullicaecorum]|nr:tape measure protein [Butyricicoccus pullicaecorum]